jgi:hypothetical protein
MNLDIGDPRKAYRNIKSFGGPRNFDPEFSSFIMDHYGTRDICFPLNGENRVAAIPPKLQSTKSCLGLQLKEIGTI